MIPRRLVIRADASPRIGTGHVMRCLALAQAWQETGGQVTFLMAAGAPALASRLQQEGMAVTSLAGHPGTLADAAQTVSLARQLGAAWVVVDGYHFGPDYQRIIKDAGLGLLFIDDEGHGEHYYADFVLNQNIYARPGLYKARDASTRLLLGPRYALLRREFWPWRGWRRKAHGKARKILVTLGGGDHDNVTGKVVQALGQVKVEGLEAVVIAGGANPYYRQLEETIDKLTFPARLESNVDNMPELMAWADVAITGGGSTCWETVFMELFNCIIIMAENQLQVAKALSQKKLAINLGWFARLEPNKLAQNINLLINNNGEIIHKMCGQGRNIVDGCGAHRVSEIIGDS